MIRHRRILRESESSDQLPNLPDDVIEYILAMISPSELVASGWVRTSSEFGEMIHDRLRKAVKCNVLEDKHLYEFYKPVFVTDDISLFPAHIALLKLLMGKYFCHLQELTIPIGLFAHVKTISEDGYHNTGSVFSSLERLVVVIGQKFGRLSISQHFDHLKAARILCGGKKLKEIDLDLHIDDQELITCCGLREMVRFLREVSDCNTKWNLTLRDYTFMGQGWLGPTELPKCRNKVFICFLRTILDLGITLNKLSLIDHRKSSPYMMIMTGSKHRAVYMYPEFKQCRELVVCYDIGIVAPMFAHENDRFDLLEHITIDESHVLYKADFLEYLRNATVLSKCTIHVPCSFKRRVDSCSRGCFSNPDYACFRSEGWASAVIKLPRVHIDIV